MTEAEYLCIRCRFLVTLDDCGAGIKTVSGKTICQRCWDLEVGTVHPMPLEVRRSTEAAVKDAEQK